MQVLLELSGNSWTTCYSAIFHFLLSSSVLILPSPFAVQIGSIYHTSLWWNQPVSFNLYQSRNRYKGQLFFYPSDKAKYVFCTPYNLKVNDNKFVFRHVWHSSDAFTLNNTNLDTLFNSELVIKWRENWGAKWTISVHEIHTWKFTSSSVCQGFLWI